MTLHTGNSADVLKIYSDNYFDSIVTDPPYGIEFLKRDWDNNTGAIEVWRECLRVLKPGGHLLAFSSARTYHRLATNIEDIGFEIRDQLMWLQNNNFPKSKNLLKPAHEPILMAMKKGKGNILNTTDTKVNGRYPANVLGDLGDYQKYFFSPKVNRKERNIGLEMHEPITGKDVGAFSKGERLAVKLDKMTTKHNNHPTVKPVSLMKYLVTLVTPKGGKVLDPFNGSGSTGMAVKEFGGEYTGIDLDPHYIEISTKRIEAW
jgi:DNA modification methylase